MPKKRIHELAKELGVANKEVLDFLHDKGIEAKSHMSSVEDEHVGLVENKFKKKSSAAPKTEEPKAEAPKAEGSSKTEETPKKKHIARVFNPHNSQGNRNRNNTRRQVTGGPRPQNGQGNRPANNQQAKPAPSRPILPNVPTTSQRAAQAANAPSAPVSQSTQSTNNQSAQNTNSQNTQNTSGQNTQNTSSQNAQSTNSQNTQSNRPVNSSTSRPAGQQSNGYQGNRPNNGGNSYQGNRPNNGGNGYQGNRPNNGGNGYQGNRPNNGGNGYQGNRPNNGGNGYQGNRPNNGGNGYQGNRPNNGGNGYQGNRPNNGGNGYQGNRPNNGGNGYQGNRPNNGGNGYQGNRPNNGGNGYQNNRPGGPRKDDRRDGAVAAPITDQKPTRAKGNKNDYKKKDNNRNYNDGPRGRHGRGFSAPLQRPQHKVEKVEEKIKMITIPEILTIGELAEAMKMVPSAIVKKLFLQGEVVTVNQEISYEKAEEIALEFEILCEKEVVVDVIEELLKEEEESQEGMVKRPPVVCVMGHVDHGKTSLLDAIRNTNIIDREAGGITQHIGAYVAEVNGEKITFLDTPGHEAFTAMRMRGANSTDIAILVVAADDGVMPQTVEAINHAKAAGIEIIVAVNKIDKPSANIDKVKQELAEYELIPEDWGGTTVFAPVSAKSGEGLDNLLEMILLTAEVMELKANPDRQARGLVIEAELDKGKGSVATVLVQKGTLHVGDAIAAGSAHGKVRAMMDATGKRVKEAGPSVPVEILGLNDVPNAGEVFVGCENDKEARTFAETFISQNKKKLLDETKSKSVSLDDIFSQIQEGNLKELGIIVKADVQGSVEAMKQSLVKLSNEEVVVKVIHGGVGAINESDVSLASASNAIIIGFNVRPDAVAKDTADREGVDIRQYSVIYNAIDDVESAMKGMLEPVFEEKVIGHAEIRQLFKSSGVGTIAGSYVLDGVFERGCSVRITREGEQIFEGKLASLKRFKDDVKEVKTGFECGLVFEDFSAVKEEDKVEAFKMVEVPR